MDVHNFKTVTLRSMYRALAFLREKIWGFLELTNQNRSSIRSRKGNKDTWTHTISIQGFPRRLQNFFMVLTAFTANKQIIRKTRRSVNLFTGERASPQNFERDNLLNYQAYGSFNILELRAKSCVPPCRPRLKRETPKTMWPKSDILKKWWRECRIE